MSPAPAPVGSRGWIARPEARSSRGPRPSTAARDLHRALPGYAASPLVEATALATRWGVGRVLVKDESSRLGLPAFKALGASYAIARVLADRAGADPSRTWVQLVALAEADPVTLVTATDGNHGRAVARFARLLGLAAEVLVPDVMTQSAAAAIATEGAAVLRTEAGYDDTVRAAAARAEAMPGRVLVQDTAWPGYERVPGWIVEGYQTMLTEATDQLAGLGLGEPDLVAVPVGVGSLAQAVVGYYRGQDPPSGTAVLSCEPEAAACVLASLERGEPVSIETATTTMAGLSCGTPSSLAWPVLSEGLDAAVAVTDTEAAAAVALLAASGVRAGASGAASLAGVEAALTGAGSATRRRELGLGAASVVVLINTEGATGAGDAA